MPSISSMCACRRRRSNESSCQLGESNNRRSASNSSASFRRRGHCNDHSSSNSDEPDETPCYPFPGAIQLEVPNGKRIDIAMHSSSCDSVEAVVVFFPGIHGGVGPGRTPGTNFDEHAIFPTVARDISSKYPVSCIRVSWWAMHPPLRDVVQSAVLATNWILREVYMDSSFKPVEKPRKVIIVGHSMGGGVALATARILKEQVLSLSDPWLAQAELGGVATFAAQQSGALGAIGYLEGVPKVLYHGENDRVLSPDIARTLYDAAASPVACNILKRCGHDFFERKEDVLRELPAWILKHSLGIESEEHGLLE